MEVEVKSYEPVGGPDASFKRASAITALTASRLGLPVGVIPEPVPFLSLSALQIDEAPPGQGPQ